MRILAIETSCDETGIAILGSREAGSRLKTITVRSNIILSQALLHAEYGGVFPALARREHAKAIVPVIIQALREAGLVKEHKIPRVLTVREGKVLAKIFHKEPVLLIEFQAALLAIKKPDIDAIAVTAGPGLEPALWVGINTATALGALWDIPVIPVNHMEGHIVASLLNPKSKVKNEKSSDNTIFSLTKPKYPSLALLISGGHTELVLMQKPGVYKILGQTRDDAVGEAFDKVARMLGLAYPGGPEISRIAETAPKLATPPYPLPRPMLKSPDFDFSFAGLKTAVLYTVKKIENLTPEIKASIAKEFEDACVEILLTKTLAAAKKYKVNEIVLGGGVTANKKIRAAFQKAVSENFQKTTLFIPGHELSTDNGLMIGVAGFLRASKPKKTIRAQGTMRLAKSSRHPTLAELRKKKKM
jgi:N6-L-threonylcarbamoyladenine synthase